MSRTEGNYGSPAFGTVKMYKILARALASFPIPAALHNGLLPNGRLEWSFIHPTGPGARDRLLRALFPNLPNEDGCSRFGRKKKPRERRVCALSATRAKVGARAPICQMVDRACVCVQKGGYTLPNDRVQRRYWTADCGAQLYPEIPLAADQSTSLPPPPN
ncbi:hypothetical protein ZHAS_00012160 [Anopheles sinensis]|uniref:Uncharacterized protein n=1 Tax=Anopheles sinensis TaxID=74873 RepID=A0A084W248_ANOSI|nr:hypothetical protein ZHAS_00012160 [Anopheles sinensis]